MDTRNRHLGTCKKVMRKMILQHPERNKWYKTNQIVVFSLAFILVTIVSCSDTSTPFALASINIDASSVAISPDGQYIAIGTDQEVILYKTDNLSRLWSQRMVDWVWDIEFSPSNENVLAITADGVANMLAIKTGELQKQYRSDFGKIKDAEFSLDGNLLAYSEGTLYENYIVIVNWQTDEIIQELEDGGGLIWFPGNERLATHSSVSFRIWDIQSGVVLKNTEREPVFVGGGCFEKIFCGGDIILGPNDEFYIAEQAYRRVDVLDPDTLEAVFTINHSTVLTTLSWSPDGRMLALGDQNGTITLWNIGDDGPKYILDAGEEGTWVTSLIWSLDGSILVSSGGNVITVWNIN